MNNLAMAASTAAEASGGLLLIGTQTLDLVAALLSSRSLSIDLTLALTQVLSFAEQSFTNQGVGLVANATPLMSLSGGLNYVLNALLGVNTDLTLLSPPAVVGSLSMATATTTSLLTVLNAVAAHQLTVSNGLSVNGALEQLGSNQLNFTLTITESGRGSFSATFGLFATVVHMMSGGRQVDTTVGLAILNALAARGLLGFDGQVLLANAVALQLLSDLSRYGTVALNAMQMLLVNGVFDAIRHILMVAQTQIHVSRTFVNFLVETPDDRKFWVTLDSRLVDVAGDNRMAVVGSDPRVVYVPAEDRSYLVIRR